MFVVSREEQREREAKWEEGAVVRAKMAAVMTTQEALITDEWRYELNSLTTPVPERHFRPALSISVCVCVKEREGKM